MHNRLQHLCEVGRSVGGAVDCLLKLRAPLRLSLLLQLDALAARRIERSQRLLHR